MKKKLSHWELLELQRWNTPTIYNGWEQITRHNSGHDGFNLEAVNDYMPEMGSMAGYAITVVIEPGNGRHPENNPSGWSDYRDYVASVPGPKIVVVQDLDKPGIFGSFWGEVNSNFHKALGCVGSIADGGVRDVDEMKSAGFKVLARHYCVGHAHSWPVRWNCEVEVFGRKVKPGQLIHADKHGFLAIPDEDHEGLLEAARYMDYCECKTVIAAARDAWDKKPEVALVAFNQASSEFAELVKNKFKHNGEW